MARPFLALIRAAQACAAQRSDITHRTGAICRCQERAGGGSAAQELLHAGRTMLRQWAAAKTIGWSSSNVSVLNTDRNSAYRLVLPDDFLPMAKAFFAQWR